MTLRISVWSGPRNVSTALMYSFAQRPDTAVVDEPLYGYYLKTTGSEHPGKDHLLEVLEKNPDKIISKTILGFNDKPVYFIKNMCHHLVGLDESFLDELVNLFLIRDPREMLPSLVNQLPHPVLRDTGLDKQLELFKKLKAAGKETFIFDSKDLLLNPEGMLRAFCSFVGIPFYKQMLAWEAGARPEDGAWAPYWYDNVHKSTGFAQYTPKNEKIKPELQPLMDESIELYEELYKSAVKV
ncbi:sulfotransferase family protein [uncultured Imperialibacter sp.]|uniref:sulfotransferase-like domain-containing protein n=1 Tax=uncultured Imperialibacter sp. TaxID=1672639 RepID=UPI0030D9EEBA|tara:strand:- start:137058 stop:137777 length:720 start_codon:yes stop_codon:yes gene_type:complete